MPDDAYSGALDCVQTPDTHQTVGNVLSIWRGGISLAPETMAQIACEVATKYGLTVQELKSEARARYISWPRQEAIWRARQVRSSTGTRKFSYPMIGRFFGGRDHTTAIHSERAYAKRLLEGVELDR